MSRSNATLGPYFARDGKTFCARCGRLPLEYSATISAWFCRHCDAGELPRMPHYPVELVDGELRCGRCHINEMTPTAGLGALECPSCDLPPWEASKLMDKTFAQLTLSDGTVMDTYDDITETPDRPPRPADIVRTCPECKQRLPHYYAFKSGHWRALCPGCGHMIARVRDRSGARYPKRGVRK